MSIDTQAIQQQYKITDVLERYGHKPKIGRFKYCCPLHQDGDPSFSVKNMSDGSQRFKCHSVSCGKHGDVLQLVMELEGCTMPKAVEILTGQEPVTGRPPSPKAKATMLTVDRAWGNVPRRKEPEWAREPNRFIGQRISAKNADGSSGVVTPQLLHLYRDRDGALVCATARIARPDGGKAVIPLRYAVEEGAWHKKGYTDGAPTPLYGANRLVGNDLPVLVVEGEKVVDIVQPILEGHYVVVCWLGGTGQVEYATWSELAGRDVTIWPDFDHLKPNQKTRTGQDAAEKAARLLDGIGTKRLRLIDITDFSEGQYKDGWDAADACDPDDTNALGKTILPWIERRAKPFGKTGNWLPDGLRPVMTGGEHPSVKKDDPTNLWLLLLHNPQFKGRFTYDVFDQVVLVDNKPMNGAALRNLRLEITQSKWPLQPKIKDLQDSVVALALENRTNLFARSLMALRWDGKPRLQAESMVLQEGGKGLLVDYANCEDTPFNRVIGMRWMIGCAQRLLQNPNSQTGWQHDSILVLEGEQGLRKTSFLRVLGSVLDREAYTELQGSLGRDKDDLMKLRGKCIVELAEMTAHRKSDQDAFKAFIDKKVDEYRPPYGSEIIKQPRMVVFAGTTNRDTYLNDPTGARRFWPARVEAEIDTHRLKQDLEQIWAEAVHLARNGEPNHLQGEELEWHEVAVENRNQLEAWESMFDRQVPANVEGFTLEQAFSFVGIVSASDMTAGATRRMEDLLTRKGYKYRQGDPRSGKQTAKWLWRLTRSRTKKTKLLPRP